jgi:hypothetical protein
MVYFWSRVFGLFFLIFENGDRYRVLDFAEYGITGGICFGAREIMGN